MKKVLYLSIFFFAVAALAIFLQAPLIISKYYKSFKLASEYTGPIQIDNFSFDLNGLLFFKETTGFVTILSPNPFSDGSVWITNESSTNKLFSPTANFDNFTEQSAVDTILNGRNAVILILTRKDGKHLRRINFYDDGITATFFGDKSDFKYFKKTFESIRIVDNNKRASEHNPSNLKRNYESQPSGQ